MDTAATSAMSPIPRTPTRCDTATAYTSGSAAISTAIPASTDAFTVEVNDAKTVITITATAGNVFDDQGTTEVVYTATDSGEPCLIDVPEPQQTDPCGPNNAFFDVINCRVPDEHGWLTFVKKAVGAGTKR